MNLLLSFIIGALAVYRLAHLITIDNGPFMVFDKLRKLADSLAEKNSIFKSLSLGLSCPYCVGVWAALFCAVLLVYRSTPTDIFLLTFGLAGLQSIIQKYTE
jgi:hypothetical protein